MAPPSPLGWGREAVNEEKGSQTLRACAAQFRVFCAISRSLALPFSSSKPVRAAAVSPGGGFTSGSATGRRAAAKPRSWPVEASARPWGPEGLSPCPFPWAPEGRVPGGEGKGSGGSGGHWCLQCLVAVRAQWEGGWMGRRDRCWDDGHSGKAWERWPDSPGGVGSLLPGTWRGVDERLAAIMLKASEKDGKRWMAANSCSGLMAQEDGWSWDTRWYCPLGWSGSRNSRGWWAAQPGSKGSNVAPLKVGLELPLSSLVWTLVVIIECDFCRKPFTYINWQPSLFSE